MSKANKLAQVILLVSSQYCSLNIILLFFTEVKNNKTNWKANNTWSSITQYKNREQILKHFQCSSL